MIRFRELLAYRAVWGKYRAMTSRNLIYCDGACLGNPGPGGWGAIVATPEGNVRELGGSDPKTTNNRMEMGAAIAALAAVSDNQAPTLIHTDSTYLIKGITEWIHGWRRRDWKSKEGADVANRDLWEKLDALVGARRNPITWVHVRGHSGVPGNERCDQIAVAFSQGTFISLYRGPLATYETSLEPVANPALASGKSSRRSSSAKAHSYVSLLGGVPMRHQTWADCERRVKGQPNAKYRKTASREDEVAILREWGVDITQLK